MFIAKSSTLSMLKTNHLATQPSRMIFSKMFAAAFGSNNDPSNPRVYFDLSKNNTPIGRMTFELYANKCPITAENFRSICAADNKHGYTYADSHFHRIIEGFMAQGGDFTRHNGTGGVSIYGAKFDDEPSGLAIRHTKRGQLSMANAGPNTNGSQFFITFEATPWLNGNHAVFGELIDGEDILKAMEAAGSRSGKPGANFTIVACGELKDDAEAKSE